MTTPRAPAAPDPVERLIVQIGAAVNMRALYAPGHPNLERAIAQLQSALRAACDARRQDGVTFLIVGEDVILDERPLRRGGMYHDQFVKTLTRRGVERLTLARGLPAEECASFLDSMAIGGTPQTSDHVIVGNVEIRASGDSPEAGGEQDEAAGLSERVDAAREGYTAFRADRRAGLRRLEQIVWSMMDALSRATREVLPLAPLKSHDEYTFVHSVNVSLLTLAQARALGFQQERLHAIGTAALLHDIGKLKVPLEVLNKPGKLEGREWTLMQGHTVLGAQHLCGVEGEHPLAILVAYEHHLRFDGQPSYPVPKRSRRPSLAAQVTAISDVFDAICTTRPYSNARPKDVAFGILRQRAGSWHDPFLLGNFARILGLAPE
ncbi:MAG: HD-GYP domain-containing protein [Vicinamibacteria bacterium]